jgi:hypothetical protein
METIEKNNIKFKPCFKKLEVLTKKSYQSNVYFGESKILDSNDSLSIVIINQ